MEQLSSHGGHGMILLGKRVVVESQGWLLQYDLESGSEDRVQVGPSRVNSILGSTGSVVAVQLGDSAEALELLWWDLASGMPAGRLVLQGTDLVIEGSLTAAPAAVVAWAGGLPLLAELDLEAGRAVLHDLPWLNRAERGFSVAAPQGSRQVLVLDHEGPAVVYDLKRREVAEQLPVHFPHNATVQTGTGGSLWLANYGFQGGGLVQVDPRTWKVLRNWDVSWPYFLAVDPSGRYGAVRCTRMGDRRVVVLDLQTDEGLSEMELPKHPGWTAGPCLLSDGRLVTWSTSAGFEIVTPTNTG